MQKMGWTAIWVVVFLCGFAPVARAQDGWLWESFTATAYNPLGLVEVVTLSYRYTLYDSKNPVFSTNFVEPALVMASTPAYGFAGLQLDVQPLSVLRLRARAEAIGFYGNFGHVARFEATDVDYSDTRLAELNDQGAHEATYGARYIGTALLQAKVGQVAVRSHLQATRVDLELGDDEPFYYSPQYDHLVQDGGWFVQNDLDLLWLFESGLVAGLRLNSSGAVFAGEFDGVDDPNGPSHRLGPLVVWPFFEGQGRVREGKFIGLANWYVEHRWRAGQDTSQAIPFVAVALQLQGDL